MPGPVFWTCGPAGRQVVEQQALPETAGPAGPHAGPAGPPGSLKNERPSPVKNKKNVVRSAHVNKKKNAFK